MKNVFVLVIIFSFGACGPDSGNPEPKPPIVTGPEACRDYVNALLNICTRCYEDYEQECRAAFLEVLDLNCNEVQAVRDQDVFYKVCIKQIDDLTCREFEEGDLELDPRCNGQLLI